MRSFFLLFCVLFSFTALNAQQDDKDWKLYNPEKGKDTLVKPVLVAGAVKSIVLKSTGKEGTVQVKKDSRLDGLTEFVGTPQNGKSQVTMKGYRIQAYLDKNKDAVNGKRAEYLAKFDKQPAYIDFLAPNFRLRIGDFRTKLDAQKYLEEIKVVFPDGIIVMEEINLPKL